MRPPDEMRPIAAATAGACERTQGSRKDSGTPRRLRRRLRSLAVAASRARALDLLARL